MKYNYRFILYTLGRFKPIGWMFKLIYQYSITRLMKEISEFEFIDSIFLKGSFLDTRFVPILSDLDFVILGDVTKSNENQIQKAFDKLNPVFPMLSDYDFYTIQDFEILKTFGGIKFIGIEKWKCLKGTKIKTSYVYYPKKMDLDIIHEIYFQFEWLFKNLRVRREGHAYHSLGIQRQYDKVKDLLFYLDHHQENLIVPRISWRSWGKVTNEEIIIRFNQLVSSNEKISSLLGHYREKKEDYSPNRILNEKYYFEQLEIIKEGFEYTGKMHYFTLPVFELFYLSGSIDSYLIHEGIEEEEIEYQQMLTGLFYAKLIQGRVNSREGVELYTDNKEQALTLKETVLNTNPISNTYQSSYYGKDIYIRYRWNHENLEYEFSKLEKDEGRLLVVFDFVPAHNEDRNFVEQEGLHYIQVLIPNIYSYPGIESSALVRYIVNWCHDAKSLIFEFDDWKDDEQENIDHSFNRNHGSGFDFSTLGLSIKGRHISGTPDNWKNAANNVSDELDDLLMGHECLGQYNRYIRSKIFLKSFIKSVRGITTKDERGYSFLNLDDERSDDILDFLQNYHLLDIQAFYWKLSQYEERDFVELEYPNAFTEKIDSVITKIEFGFRKDSYILREDNFQNTVVLTDDGTGRPSKIRMYFKFPDKYEPGFYSYDLSLPEYFYNGEAQLKVSASSNPYCQIDKVCESSTRWDEKGFVEIQEDTKGIILEITAIFKMGVHKVSMDNLLIMPHAGARMVAHDCIVDFTISSYVDFSDLPIGAYKIIIYPCENKSGEVSLTLNGEVLRTVFMERSHDSYTMEFFKQEWSKKQQLFLIGEGLGDIRSIDILRVDGIYRYDHFCYDSLLDSLSYQVLFEKYISGEITDAYEFVESFTDLVNTNIPFKVSLELPGFYKAITFFNKPVDGLLNVRLNGVEIYQVKTSRSTDHYVLLFYKSILPSDITIEFTSENDWEIDHIDIQRHEDLFDKIDIENDDLVEVEISMKNILEGKRNTSLSNFYNFLRDNDALTYEAFHSSCLYNVRMYDELFSKYCKDAILDKFQFVKSLFDLSDLEREVDMDIHIPGFYKAIVFFKVPVKGLLLISLGNTEIYKVETTKEKDHYILFFYKSILPGVGSIRFETDEEYKIDHVDIQRHEDLFDKIIVDDGKLIETEISLKSNLDENNESSFEVLFNMLELSNDRIVLLNQLTKGYYKFVVYFNTTDREATFDLNIDNSVYSEYEVKAGSDIIVGYFFVPNDCHNINLHFKAWQATDIKSIAILKHLLL